MEGKELSILLREMACSQKTPLCEEWTKAWDDDSDLDTLIDKYVRGFDFVVKNDYPPLWFCRKYFKKEDIHKYNIYLDDEIDLTPVNNGYYIFIGECSGRVIFDGIISATVYVRHKSNIDVVAKNGAKVFVTYYEQSKGKCNKDDYSYIRKSSKNRL